MRVSREEMLGIANKVLIKEVILILDGQNRRVLLYTCMYSQPSLY